MIPRLMDPKASSLVDPIGQLIEEAKKLVEHEDVAIAVILVRMADIGLEELFRALDDGRVIGSGPLVNQIWRFFEELNSLRNEFLRRPTPLPQEGKCKLHLA